MAKIMLVEDDNNLREIYGARLQAEGHEIVAAKDGEEALALAVKEKPELIISDVMMPRISGFDMLDILRNAPETKNTKVIMMTALSQAEDKARADKLGADRYLVKSQVTLEDVAKVVRDVLEGTSEGEETKLESITAASTPPSTDAGATVTAVPASVTPPVSIVPEPVSPPPADPEPPVVPPPSASPPPPPADPVAPEPPVAVATPPPVTPNPPPSPPPDEPVSPPPADPEPPVVPPPPDEPVSPPPADPVAPEPPVAVATPPPAVPPDSPVEEAPNPEIIPLKTPELAAAEALLTNLPEPAPAAPAATTTPTSPVILPTPPDEVVAAAPEAPLPATPPPATPAEEKPEDASSFVGPNLAQALAAEEDSSNTPQDSSAASAPVTPTIINGVEQSGLITPTPPEPPTEKVEEPPAKPVEDTSEVHAQPSTPLEQENASHKKVISPISDPVNRPDLNALLAAEEQKAAVINPTAGTSISPAVASTPTSPDKGVNHNDIAL